MRKSIWIIAAGLAIGLFGFRGIARSLDDSLKDFAAPFAGTRLFWQGDNPYDSDSLAAALEQAGASSPAHTPAVYPPVSFLALTPLAFLPVPAAKTAVVLLGLTMLAAGSWLWMQTVNVPRASGLALGLFVFASAPLHTAIWVVNPALLACGAVLFGSALIERKHHRWGGFILLWALLIKPQIGAAGVGWCLLTDRRLAGISMSLIWAGLLGLALWKLQLSVPEALDGWRTNLAEESTSGSISASASLGMQRIDPAGLWHAITGAELMTVAQVTFAGVVVLWGIRWPKQNAATSIDSLRILAIIGIGLLLSGYHRAYDALLLIPLGLWVAASRDVPKPGPVWALIGTAFLWIMPGGGFWWKLGQLEPFAQFSIVDSGIWHLGLMRLHCWALLLAAVMAVRLTYLKSATSTE